MFSTKKNRLIIEGRCYKPIEESEKEYPSKSELKRLQRSSQHERNESRYVKRSKKQCAVWEWNDSLAGLPVRILHEKKGSQLFGDIGEVLPNKTKLKRDGYLYTEAKVYEGNENLIKNISGWSLGFDVSGDNDNVDNLKELSCVREPAIEGCEFWIKGRYSKQKEYFPVKVVWEYGQNPYSFIANNVMNRVNKNSNRGYGKNSIYSSIANNVMYSMNQNSKNF